MEQKLNIRYSNTTTWGLLRGVQALLLRGDRAQAKRVPSLQTPIAIVFFLFLVFITNYPLFAQESQKPEEFAGEFSAWGVKVPLSNYYFTKGTIAVFGVRWGPTPTTPQEVEDAVWEQLVLSYEAFKREIKVEPKEVEEEIFRLLKSEKVEFDWQKDKPAYEKWVKERTAEPVELFENQLRHLIQLQKLRNKVMEGIKPEVSEEEAHQEFLNEHNTLSVELAQFDNLVEAENFYKKVKNKPRLWEKESRDNPKLFRRPGFVALEFLIEMWKIPKDDLYKMLALDVGAIYPATAIYGGKYAVFKILEKRLAEEARFPELRPSYYEQIEMKKKYVGLDEWIKKLKDDSRLKVYIVKSETQQDQNK